MLIVATSALVGASAAAAAPTQFTAGDLVVYEVQGTSSAASAVDLVDYSTAGVPSGFAVDLPTADSGTTHAVVESGSALNDGELTLSADGLSLVATGYDAAVGTASITSATNTARSVAVVPVGTGAVDTSTSLTDTTSESNNFRSATVATAGGSIYTGNGAGAGIAVDGSSSATALNTDNVHEVLDVGGTLYESTATAINRVGVAGTLPTGGSPADTALTTGPSKFDPDEFALVTLGSGPGPNTLYVADGAGGSKSGGVNAVEKYSLESGVWTLTGSVTVDQVVGLAATVSNNVASIYVTAATSTSAANNTVLAGITDSSGFGGTLAGTATTLATAPSGTDFKGLALLPASPAPQVPESPLTILLPIGALMVIGGYVVLRRRHQRMLSRRRAALKP